jgi:hypothetical protein
MLIFTLDYASSNNQAIVTLAIGVEYTCTTIYLIPIFSLAFSLTSMLLAHSLVFTLAIIS